jgi:hypothetical protein
MIIHFSLWTKNCKMLINFTKQITCDNINTEKMTAAFEITWDVCSFLLFQIVHIFLIKKMRNKFLFLLKIIFASEFYNIFRNRK